MSKKLVTDENMNELKNQALGIIEAMKKFGFNEKQIEEFDFEKQVLQSANNKGSFANFGSFAYWGDKEKKKDISPKVVIKSVEALQNWSEKDVKNIPLRNDIVMLGVNAGQAASGKEYEHFEMFHYQDPKTKNSAKSKTLKYYDIIKDTVLYNSYMTDFYKGIPTKDSNGLEARLNKICKTCAKIDNDIKSYKKYREMLYKAFGYILLREIVALGYNVKVICIMQYSKEGKTTIQKAIEFLQEENVTKEVYIEVANKKLSFKDFKVVNIPHYAGMMKTDEFKKVMNERINEIKGMLAV